MSATQEPLHLVAVRMKQELLAEEAWPTANALWEMAGREQWTSGSDIKVPLAPRPGCPNIPHKSTGPGQVSGGHPLDGLSLIHI